MSLLRKIWLLLSFGSTSVIFSQTGSSCASPIDFGTPGGTSTCFSQANGTTGSAPCAGAGYGGNSGGVTYVKFCTGAAGSCISFDITNTTTSGNWAVTYYNVGCTTSFGGECIGAAGTGVETTTSDNGLSANTCYIARFWSENAGTFSICTKTVLPTNNLCGSPTQISSVAQPGTNLCANASTTDPPPSQFGAGSLENNIWYSFTTNTLCVSSCSVVVSITNISCIGGGSGFQIGYWSGSCTGTSTTSLTYLGNTTGSGGTVTTTITGLSSGQQITMGIDGNAGANCTFSISASNTVLLPVDLIYFYGYQIEKTNYLEWASISETSVDYFIIERSKDGVMFEEMSRVPASGNSNSKKVYSVIDEKATDEFTYYRLTSVNQDKTSKIYSVVSINNPNNRHLFNVFPNPVKSLIHFSFDDENISTHHMVTIVDFRGNVVKEFDFKANNDAGLDVSDLKSGIYNLNMINDSGEFQSLKFMKE
jgi:hypothetical protein